MRKTFLMLFFVSLLIMAKEISANKNQSIGCPQSFQSYNENAQTPLAIESYDETLVRLSRFHLGIDDLSQGQIEALKNYHTVAQGEGKDKTPAKVSNYTLGQIRRIIRFLEEEFSREQVRTLIEDGVVEIDRFYLDAVITKRVVRKLREGKPIFASKINIEDRDNPQNITLSSPMKIKNLIEETDNGFLVEVEMIDISNGRLYTTQQFLLRASSRHAFDLTVPTTIVERTNSGFVINRNTSYNRKVGFLSFERAIKNGFLPKNPTAQDYISLENDISSDYINTTKNQVFYSQIFYSLDTKQEDDSLQSLFAKAFIPGINVRIENPEFESIFLAADSSREKISLDELNLPPTTNEEAELADQGYKTDYIGGLEEVNERAAVRRGLQELKANPRKTHVEYFAKLILDYIAHIRQGLENNYSPGSKCLRSKSDQLQKLKTLEEKTKEAIENERVTYEWFLRSSKNLSFAMEGGYINMDPATVYDIEITNDLEFFPVKIKFPTTKNSDIGTFSFNRAASEAVYPAGLIDRQAVKVDGISLTSSSFYSHDGFHSKFLGNMHFTGYSAGHRLFHKRLLENIKKLPPKQRKTVANVYFIMSHENLLHNLSCLVSRSPLICYDYRTQLKDLIMNKIEDDVSGVFKLPTDSAQIQRKIETLADTFIAVYNQTVFFLSAPLEP